MNFLEEIGRILGHYIFAFIAVVVGQICVLFSLSVDWQLAMLAGAVYGVIAILKAAIEYLESKNTKGKSSDKSLKFYLGVP